MDAADLEAAEKAYKAHEDGLADHLPPPAPASAHATGPFDSYKTTASEIGSFARTQHTVRESRVREEFIMQQFQVFDRDSSGFIDLAELEAVLGASLPGCPQQLLAQVAKVAMLRGDTNKDGALSYDEFAAVYNDLVDMMNSAAAMASEFNNQPKAEPQQTSAAPQATSTAHTPGIMSTEELTTGVLAPTHEPARYLQVSALTSTRDPACQC